MAEHNLLKKLSIGIASLALICPLAMSGLNTNANARRRRPRTHKVYRHHRRATRRRRGRRTKRTRKARRSHRRVARKATRRPRIIKAHKARRTHKHHVNNDSLLATYEHEAPVHHESQAQWYKNNGESLYDNNINSSRMFRQGWYDGTKITNTNYENDSTFHKLGCPGLHRQYTSDPQYKHGWIVGVAQDSYNTTDYDAYSFKADGSMRKFIRITPRKYWNDAVNTWNSGMSYMNENPQTNKFDYNFGDDGMWTKD